MAIKGIRRYWVVAAAISVCSLAMGLWLVASRSWSILAWPFDDWVEVAWVAGFPAVWTSLCIKAFTTYGDRARRLLFTAPLGYFGIVAWVIYRVAIVLFFVFEFGVCMFGVC